MVASTRRSDVPSPQCRSVGGRWCSIGVAQTVTMGLDRICMVRLMLIYQLIIVGLVLDDRQ